MGRVPVRGKLCRVLRSKAMVEPSRKLWNSLRVCKDVFSHVFVTKR